MKSNNIIGILEALGGKKPTIEFSDLLVDACINRNVSGWFQFLRLKDGKIQITDPKQPLNLTKTKVVLEEDEARKVQEPIDKGLLADLKVQFFRYYLGAQFKAWLTDSTEPQVTTDDVGLTMEQVRERHRKRIEKLIAENIGG